MRMISLQRIIFLKIFTRLRKRSVFILSLSFSFYLLFLSILMFHLWHSRDGADFTIFPISLFLFHLYLFFLFILCFINGIPEIAPISKFLFYLCSPSTIFIYTYSGAYDEIRNVN